MRAINRRDAPGAQRRSSPDTDVGGDDAHRARGAGELDVVDAHDLAAVDVDDLLVEQSSTR